MATGSGYTTPKHAKSTGALLTSEGFEPKVCKHKPKARITNAFGEAVVRVLRIASSQNTRFYIQMFSPGR